jgi:hypothetical protein
MKPTVHSDSTKYTCEAIYTCYFMLHCLQQVPVPIEASSGTQNTREHTYIQLYNHTRQSCMHICLYTGNSGIKNKFCISLDKKY